MSNITRIKNTKFLNLTPLHNHYMHFYLPDGYFTFGYLPVPRNLTAMVQSVILLLGADINPFYHTASIVEIEAYCFKGSLFLNMA